MNLRDSVVVITGAGSGIGRALALELARNGARVVCSGRRRDHLEETKAAIEKQEGHALVLPADVTNIRQVKHMVEAILSQSGRIDALINNAGSFQCLASCNEIDPRLWWGDVTVNLLGPMLLIRHVLPRMLERDQGIIVNVDGGRPVGGSSYASSKAALMELTRILNLELRAMKSSVLVYSAKPPLVDTQMNRRHLLSPNVARWLPGFEESLQKDARPAEDLALATVRFFACATIENSGKSFNADTDFTSF